MVYNVEFQVISHNWKETPSFDMKEDREKTQREDGRGERKDGGHTHSTCEIKSGKKRRANTRKKKRQRA